jgi:hypothetical protein
MSRSSGTVTAAIIAKRIAGRKIFRQKIWDALTLVLANWDYEVVQSQYRESDEKQQIESKGGLTLKPSECAPSNIYGQANADGFIEHWHLKGVDVSKQNREDITVIFCSIVGEPQLYKLKLRYKSSHVIIVADQVTWRARGFVEFRNNNKSATRNTANPDRDPDPWPRFSIFTYRDLLFVSPVKAKKSRDSEAKKSGDSEAKKSIDSKKEPIDSGEECPICLSSDSKADFKILVCKHSFCAKCIGEWTQKNASCPLCRRDVDKASLAC